jgi:hypothetical protein
MKKILALALAVVSLSALAQVDVNGYYKSNGTYVAPYHRTAPNNTISDNYSTRGNINPYTGQPGTVPNNQFQAQVAQQQAESQRQFQQQQLMQQQQMQLQQQQLLQMQRQQQMQQQIQQQQRPKAGCNPLYPYTC